MKARKVINGKFNAYGGTSGTACATTALQLAGKLAFKHDREDTVVFHLCVEKSLHCLDVSMNI